MTDVIRGTMGGFRRAALAAAAGAALAVSPARGADAGGAEDLDMLDMVVVKGQLLERHDGAFTVTTLGRERIREERVSQMQELFRQVPGMNVLDYGLPGVGNAIVLRGFGGGGHGGDLGTAVDGIPLNEAMSHADGYVDFGVVVPLEVEDLDVQKGPISPLYGNFNKSGMVEVTTRKAGEYAEADVSLDDSASFDLQLASGTALGLRQQLNLAAQYYYSEGFRPQSGHDRLTLAGRWGMRITDRSDLAVSARLHRADADSASYLTTAQFDEDAYGIDPRVQNDATDKNFGTLRVDGSHRVTDDLKLLVFAYATRQDFTRWFTRPVDPANWRQREESYDREVHGAGGSLNGTVDRWASPVNWVFGVETFRERTDYEYYDGLDRRERVAPAINDRRARLDSLSAYAQVEAPLHRLFTPSIGLRADRFSGECAPNGPETSTSPCGELNLLDHLSPKLGLRMQPTDAVGLRASWSEGFALPGGFVKYAASAAALKPTVVRQAEMGLTLRSGEALTLDLAAFRIDQTREVRQLASGEYENFGETRRRGLEATLDWRPLPFLAFTAVYGRTDSEVIENASAALVGNKVAGVSDDTGTLTARWRPRRDLTLGATLRHVGGYEIDAANSERSPAYTTLDFDGSWRLRHGAHDYRLFLGIENALDRKYAASWSRIGGLTLLAPAAPRVVRAGLQFDF